MSKTPISILQEIMMKRGDVPRYELTFSGGTPNDPIFKMTVIAGGVKVEAEGRSKKQAKQQVASAALIALAQSGIHHPDHTIPEDNPESDSQIFVNNICILKDYCCDYNMPLPEYDLKVESGPPHARKFVMICRVGTVEREGEGSTKIQARRVAAGKVLQYLRVNLTSIISEIDDDKAVAVLTEKVNKKLNENSTSIHWRPNLGQKLSEYHNGLKECIMPDKQRTAFAYIQNSEDNGDPIRKLDVLLKILELDYEWTPMPTLEGGEFMMVNIPHCHPPIAVCSSSTHNARESAAINTISHIFEMLN